MRCLALAHYFSPNHIIFVIVTQLLSHCRSSVKELGLTSSQRSSFLLAQPLGVCLVKQYSAYIYILHTFKMLLPARNMNGTWRSPCAKRWTTFFHVKVGFRRRVLLCQQSSSVAAADEHISLGEKWRICFLCVSIFIFYKSILLNSALSASEIHAEHIPYWHFLKSNMCLWAILCG